MKLQLFLAPSVEVPKQIKTISFQFNRNPVESFRFVFASSEMSDAMRNDPLLLAVEDYQYQDLIKCIHFNTHPKGFDNFVELDSDLFSALKNGRDVVLYGDF